MNKEFVEVREHGAVLCGYSLEDLIAVVQCGVTPETVKECARNLRCAYEILANGERRRISDKKKVEKQIWRLRWQKEEAEQKD